MKAEQYWQKILKGLTIPTPLMVDKSSSSLSTERTNARHAVNLSESDTANLRSFARENKLSFNVLVQGSWGLLLSRYSGDEDVLFGVTSETNIFPVRMNVAPKTPVLAWPLQRDPDRGQWNDRGRFRLGCLLDVHPRRAGWRRLSSQWHENV